jgi:drug/metabolite transporter (DMT)-like permease
MRLRSDLTLMLVALIWGTAFVAQRTAAAHLGVFLFNGLRFMLAVALLLPLALRSNKRDETALAGRSKRRLALHWLRGRGGSRPSQPQMVDLQPANNLSWLGIERRWLPWVGLTGGVLFTASALQQAGLRYTTAGNAGFITGLYVVFVPLGQVVFYYIGKSWPAFAWLKRSVRPPGAVIWFAAILALIGVFLLSSPGRFSLAPGDGLELIGAVFWALHVILVGQMAQRVEATRFATGQYLVCGVLNLMVGLLLERGTLGGVPQVGLAIVYTGVFSIAVGFTLQAQAQKYSPAADAALILSLEAVFAALAGYLLLNEILSGLQILGCGLILAAILLAQVRREGEQGDPSPN